MLNRRLLQNPVAEIEHMPRSTEVLNDLIDFAVKRVSASEQRFGGEISL
jgi:hypothetical protein